VTAPFPGSSSPGAARPPRWRSVWGPLAVVALAVALLAGYLVADDSGRTPAPESIPSTGGEVTPSELEGEWSGEGTLTDCAGFDDEACSGSRTITLTIDCAPVVCVVTPLDGGYGAPPLRFDDGRYRAAGPVPPELAPTCGGAPTRSALWQLQLVAGGGRLGGTYQESTIQGFDCGATFLAWDVVLERG
jgi:hypothetical protein